MRRDGVIIVKKDSLQVVDWTDSHEHQFFYTVGELNKHLSRYRIIKDLIGKFCPETVEEAQLLVDRDIWDDIDFEMFLSEDSKNANQS